MIVRFVNVLPKRCFKLNKGTIEYVRSTLPEKEPWEKELERQATEDNIPIMEPESMAFVKQLIRLKQPTSILEIGTAIGYSALEMLSAYPLADIVTIEQDEHRYKQANRNIQAQQKSDRIHVIHGDALEILTDLKEYRYDVIFIDAAKGKYKRFFELAQPLLNDGALIISDNVLFKGYVADNADTNPRYKKLAKKIQHYNTWLTERTDYDTSIVPIGDGVAISIKR